jgi:heme A synthase
MQVTAPPRASAGRISQPAFARYAWGVLIYNLAVIVWGAFVRVTGSGAGCGNDWPRCQGQVTLHAPTIQTIIEFTHRSTSGIDVVLVAVLAFWAFRIFPRRHPARLGVVLSVIFLITEALVGAALVLLERVAKNASAWWSTAHLLNTLTLLASLTLAAWWGSGRPALRLRGAAARFAGASLVVVALLGVTGVLAALGDTLFPARSLAEGFGQDLDPASSVLLRVRVLHPALAAGAAAWLLYYAVWAAGQRKEARRYAWILGSVVGAQLIAGVVNLVLLAPAGMQLVHLLLADLLWIALVLTAAVTLADPDYGF